MTDHKRECLVEALKVVGRMFETACKTDHSHRATQLVSLAEKLSADIREVNDD